MFRFQRKVRIGEQRFDRDGPNDCRRDMKKKGEPALKKKSATVGAANRSKKGNSIKGAIGRGISLIEGGGENEDTKKQQQQTIPSLTFCNPIEGPCALTSEKGTERKETLAIPTGKGVV